eukprot:361973-Chlamydomonas_euryale.AAC.5
MQAHAAWFVVCRRSCWDALVQTSGGDASVLRRGVRTHAHRTTLAVTRRLCCASRWTRARGRLRRAATLAARSA